jgi:hypothetical protein
MRCINSSCSEELETGAEFCPICGTRQLRTVYTDPLTGYTLKHADVSNVRVEQPARIVHNSSTEEALVMRAGQQIWHFEEPEGRVLPGYRRPLLVMDEQAVHLSHTDRRLEPQELLQRVRSILANQEVPVDVTLVKARWFSDGHEGRPRLVACLHNHPYSDIKMVMGVDYMGKWASFQLHLGIEPEALPRPPEMPHIESPAGPGICMVIGGLFALLGFAMAADRKTSGFGAFLAVLGIALLIGGLIWQSQSKIKTEEMRRIEKERWEAEQRRREVEKAVERLSRTFKVDDMRLFCTAMRQVFQAVVDDIVQRGAEIVRIEGGSGGYFQTKAEERPAPRRADAAGV